MLYSHAMNERRSRGRDETEAEHRREQSREQRWEESAGIVESRTLKTREQSERAGRDKMQMGSAGRVESREAAQTKRVSKKHAKRERDHEQWQPKTWARAVRSLVYRESTTAVVVSHVESDLHEHAIGCRKKRTRTSSASSASHMSSSHALFHKTRVWQNRLQIYIYWRMWELRMFWKNHEQRCKSWCSKCIWAQPFNFSTIL